MRTFYIALSVFILCVAWLLHKPIPRKAPVAREFTDSEIEYLEKSFDYAMDNMKQGEYLDWSAAAVNGRISVGNVYQSKQKATCRNYIEIARTYEAQKVESGIACKRTSKDGWCRLKVNDAESCALELVESPITKRSRFAILQGSQIIDDLLGTGINADKERLSPHAPSGSMPTLGPVGISKPDLEPSDFRPPMPWDPSK